MNETTRLLKRIMKTSGWTQEQVATMLGVSFPTMNAWINGKSKPRPVMAKRIRRLYLAQDITDDIKPTYVTLVNIPRRLRIGSMVALEKDCSNNYDDEAIIAEIIEEDDELLDDDSDEYEGSEDILDDSGDSLGGSDDTLDDFDDDSRGNDEEEAMACGIPVGRIEFDDIYVANSVGTVVRGTYSAGRIYDKFGKMARAKVVFIFHKVAIARVVEWNYAGEEG